MIQVSFYLDKSDDGYEILSKWENAAHEQCFSQDEIDEVLILAQTGDYENLCKVIMEHSC